MIPNSNLWSIIKAIKKEIGYSKNIGAFDDFKSSFTRVNIKTDF